VFARGPKAEEATAADADIVGTEDLMETVQGGKIDFDRCIATPDMMPIVGRLGKIPGPRNLMPNPKVGTVTMDVAQAVKAAKGGQVQFKAEKSGIVHAGVGKASFDVDKLSENVRAFINAVNRAKPPGAKGAYLGKISLGSNMGPGCRSASTASAAPQPPSLSDRRPSSLEAPTRRRGRLRGETIVRTVAGGSRTAAHSCHRRGDRGRRMRTAGKTRAMLPELLRRRRTGKQRLDMASDAR